MFQEEGFLDDPAPGENPDHRICLAVQQGQIQRTGDRHGVHIVQLGITSGSNAKQIREMIARPHGHKKSGKYYPKHLAVTKNSFIFDVQTLNQYVMNISQLMVEVTRKCNLECNHCLRGDAMNMSIKKEYIDSILEQVRNVETLIFTGGEPTLNLPAMEYFLDQCKNRRVRIGSFYIATNGVKVTESFVMFCLRMFSYCDEKEACRVDVSNDMYHMDLADFDIELLQGLSFYGKKFEKDGYNYNNGISLINEGRSKNHRHAHEAYTMNDDMTAEEFTNDCEVYLNCKGEIINGCNWSYASQKKHKLCNVGELSKYYEELCEAQLHF